MCGMRRLTLLLLFSVLLWVLTFSFSCCCSLVLCVGTDTSTTFYTLMSPKGSHFQSLKAITEMTNDIPGFHLLSFFLPQHSESPQAFLLLIALLLGQPISDVPYGAPFNSDMLMGLFESSKSRVKTLKKKSQKFLNLDAVRVLLCLLRHLLHQVGRHCTYVGVFHSPTSSLTVLSDSGTFCCSLSTVPVYCYNVCVLYVVALIQQWLYYTV